MSEINGYQLKGELTTNNAGLCRWAFCEKESNHYFIKEFLDPVYPLSGSELSSAIVERKKKICDEFFLKKTDLYNRLSQCQTGNIVYVRDFFRFGSKYYAVSDKMDFDEISISTVSTASPEAKILLFRSILYSFSKIHQNGIIHADVKPDNLLFKQTVTGYYTAKIIDFDSGFLKTAIPDEVQCDLVYLAPESFLRIKDAGVKIDEKIDIFALGLIFHQIWAGCLPKADSHYKYVFEAILDNSEVGIDQTIPVHIRLMIKKMLSKSPDERPGADDLLMCLGNI